MERKSYDEFAKDLINEAKSDIRDWKNNYLFNLSTLNGIIIGVTVSFLITGLYQEVIIDLNIMMRRGFYISMLFFLILFSYLTFLEARSYKSSIKEREDFIKELINKRKN